MDGCVHLGWVESFMTAEISQGIEASACCCCEALGGSSGCYACCALCRVPAGYGLVSLYPLVARLCTQNTYGDNVARPAAFSSRCQSCPARMVTMDVFTGGTAIPGAVPGPISRACTAVSYILLSCAGGAGPVTSMACARPCCGALLMPLCCCCVELGTVDRLCWLLD